MKSASLPLLSLLFLLLLLSLQYFLLLLSLQSVLSLASTRGICEMIISDADSAENLSISPAYISKMSISQMPAPKYYLTRFPGVD